MRSGYPFLGNYLKDPIRLACSEESGARKGHERQASTYIEDKLYYVDLYQIIDATISDLDYTRCF